MPNIKKSLTALAQDSIVAIMSQPFIQTIWYVRVKPGARSVRISFNTMHDCVPAIVLYVNRPDMSFALMELTKADRIIWPFLSGKNSYHHVEFDNLPENTTFWFRITAYADEKLTPNMLPAYQLGIFTTGRRSLDVVVDALEIWRDGDELSDGDIYFSFEPWNMETGFSIGRKRLPASGFGDFTDGSVKNLGWHISTTNAPDIIAIMTLALDDDSSLFNPGLPHIAEGPSPNPVFPPESFDRQHIRRQIHDLVTTRDIFRLPDTVGTQSIGFVIDSGQWDVLWYKFFGKLIVKGTPSAAVPVIFGTVDSKPGPFKFSGFQGIVAGAGLSANIPANGKTPELRIGIGDNGVVSWYGRDKEQVSKKMSWLRKPIAGSLTILSDPEGGHDLFAADEEGVVRRARLDVDGKAVSDWRELGGRSAGKITALRLDDGRIALFAIDCEGATSYRLAPRHPELGSGKWISLGGCCKSLFAHPAGKDRMHLIGLDAEGAAHYLQVGYEKGVSRSPRWKALGGKGFVSVGFLKGEDRDVAAFAVDAKRHLFGKLWRDRLWQPEESNWMPFGEIERVGDPDPFARYRRMKHSKAPAAKDNGALTALTEGTR